MRKQIDARSKAEGLPMSRLPRFSSEWQRKLKGSLDFLGLNHYSTDLVSHEIRTDAGWTADQDARRYQPDYWPKAASDWIKVTPLGFRKILGIWAASKARTRIHRCT